MAQRFCAVMVIVCIACEGSGCAWMKQKPPGQQVTMPLQTGSTLHRPATVPPKPEVATAASKKKNASKKTEAKRTPAKPSPTPPGSSSKQKPKRTHEPAEETPAAPDRFR